MSRSFIGKRKRGGFQHDVHRPEAGAVILSGDAAQVDYEEQLPLWKQEVTDERGRKRLHGAFTGGFSAGYFNTVGSAEGWTPTSFVSSRNARMQAQERKAVDYMDDEDLAEIIDDRELRIKNAEEKLQQEQFEQQDEAEAKQQAQSLSKPASTIQIAEQSEDRAQSLDLVLVAKSHMAKKKLAKPLSLLDADDEIDGYDIGPKIKYDAALAKKKKMKKTPADTAQHTFTARKVVRNPEPEPELVQQPQSPQRILAKTPDALLPSIGRIDTTAQTKPDASSIAGDQTAAKPMSDPTHEHNSLTSRNQSKIPPWRRKEVAQKIDLPSISQETALLALQSTFTPYPLDGRKHSRYRSFLTSQAPQATRAALQRTAQEEKEEQVVKEEEEYGQGELDWDAYMAERQEFQKCATMYKPMTGAMSRKFTTGSARSTNRSDYAQDDDDEGESAQPKSSIALQAARQGKYGHLTRSIESWTPNKLLCKRFNVAFPDANDSVNSSRQQGRHREYEQKGSDINRAALDALMKSA